MFFQSTYYAYEVQADWFIRWFDDQEYMQVLKVGYDGNGDVIVYNLHGAGFTLKPYDHVQRG